MNRREAIQRISSILGGALSAQLTAGLMGQVINLGASVTVDAGQQALLAEVAETIIPTTDTPGAKGAKVNEFIDLLLTEWFEPSEAKQFLDGLADVDVRSNAKFSTAFLDCTPAQQTELLTLLDAEAMDFLKKQKSLGAGATTLPMNFFYQLKKLTLAGYYTSEIGFSQELGRSIIPPGHAGCAPVTEVAR